MRAACLLLGLKPFFLFTLVDAHTRVFLRNLPFHADATQITQALSQFGHVKDLVIPTKSGKHRGIAIATFENRAAAEAAVVKSSFSLDGRDVAIKKDDATRTLKMETRKAEIDADVGQDKQQTRSALFAELKRAGEPVQINRLLGKLQPLRIMREFTIAISAYARARAKDPAESIWQQMIETGIEPDIIVYNAMLQVYSRCGDVDSCMQLLHNMETATSSIAPDLISYNTLLASFQCAPDGWEERVHGILQSIRAKGLKPDHESYHPLMRAAMHAHQPELALRYFKEMLLHAGLQPTARSYVILLGDTKRDADAVLGLTARLRARGIPVDMQLYKLALQSCRDLRDHTDKSIKLLEEMWSCGLQPDAACVNAVLLACTHDRRWHDVLRVYEVAETTHAVQLNVVSATLAMRACAKLREWARAEQLLQRVDEVDQGVLSAAITTCAAVGEWRQAERLFDAIPTPPDAASYTSLMTALCAAGELKRGLSLLRRMETAAATTPLDTFPCRRLLIEAHAMAGDHETARTLSAHARRRPRRHAAFAEIEAVTSGTQAHLTPDKAHGRTRFVNYGEVSAEEHAFAETLTRCTGYSPQLHSLPFGFRTKASAAKQRASLRTHAEKRALVALISTHAPQLRMKLNMHMCVDCHEFMKAASKHLQRPIFVCEPKLEHEFRDGKCSCGDDWRWDDVLGTNWNL